MRTEGCKTGMFSGRKRNLQLRYLLNKDDLSVKTLQSDSADTAQNDTTPQPKAPDVPAPPAEKPSAEYKPRFRRK